ncbi:MAG: Periplasmic protease [Bacteroidetes bacterium]|nr:Periplasmic protease [Bacteroidota bacterium]
MGKKFSFVTVMMLVVLSLAAGAMLNNVFSSDNIYEQITKFKDVLSITEKYYVDDIDTQKLTEGAIVGLLDQLDPHSTYISAADLRRVHEEFQGSFEGIGIEYQVLNDTLMVVAPIIGGPSEALGILAGDKIMRRVFKRSSGGQRGRLFTCRSSGSVWKDCLNSISRGTRFLSVRSVRRL